MSDALVPLTAAVPLGAAALLVAADRRLPAALRDAVAVAAAAATTVLAAVLVGRSRGGRVVYWFGGWRPAHGTVIGVDYAVDPLGAGLAVLAGVLALAALVYSRRFFSESGGRYPALVLVFTAASVDFAFTGDLFNMFVAFELVAVTGVVLSGYYTEEEAPLQGAVNFAVVNTIGGLVVLTAIGVLYGHTGTLNLAEMGRALQGRPAGATVAVAFALLTSGFLVKAGVVPWHFWLPDAYGAAPAPACILFAGVTSELGLFGLARCWETVFAPAFAGSAAHRVQLVLGGLGALTALVGAAMALAEAQPRRLLAFVVVAHIGIYLMGFALLRPVAVAGVALLAAADGCTKAALFLGVGVLRRHRRLTGAGALRGEGPTVAAAAGVVVVGALALADLPPFASSTGTDLVLSAAGAARPYVEAVVAVTVVASSAAVLAAAARVWQGRAPDVPAPDEVRAEAVSGWANLLLVVPPVALLAVALGLGLVPDLAGHAVRAAGSFVDGAGYRAAVLDGAGGMPPAPRPPTVGVGAVLTDAAEAAAALALAALLVVREAVGAAVGDAFSRLARLHRGHLGDQVTWTVVGAAALAGLTGLAVH